MPLEYRSEDGFVHAEEKVDSKNRRYNGCRGDLDWIGGINHGAQE